MILLSECKDSQVLLFPSPKFLAELWACSLLVPARAPGTVATSDFSIFLPANAFYLPTGNTADEGGAHLH